MKVILDLKNVLYLHFIMYTKFIFSLLIKECPFVNFVYIRSTRNNAFWKKNKVTENMIKLHQSKENNFNVLIEKTSMKQ